MAKIAVSVTEALSRRREYGSPGRADVRLLAKGEGWTVEDVICSSGPHDRPYEEQHNHVVIAIVTSGTFQYRGSGSGEREVMTPGSLLLGNPGQCFECGHEHGEGDRCISFRFTPGYFERIASGVAGRAAARRFRSLRLPPVRMLSPVVSEACAALAGSADVPWEELAVRLAAQAVRVDGEAEPDTSPVSRAAIARVTQAVRMIEEEPGEALTIVRLAHEARLSPFHFLRTFESLTGITPHQYLMRIRLRQAATRLANESTRILDIALDAGFGDVSNFTRTFRAEFGKSPRAYRQGFLRRRAGGPA